MNTNSSTTFELIIGVLSRSKDLTAHDLSMQCGIGAAAVRFHLRKMKAAGLILEFDKENQNVRAGRRSHKYRLVSQENASDLEKLCKALLLTCVENASNLQMFTDNLAGSLLDGALLPKKHGPGVYIEAVKWLNRQQYGARWEAGSKGPVFHFDNCPFRAIRSGNEIFCEMDKSILGKLTGLPWNQIRCMDWEKLVGECEFIVKQAA